MRPSSSKAEPRCCGGQLPVESPESRVIQRGRAEQMHVNPSQAAAGKLMRHHELQRLFVCRLLGLRQVPQQRQNLCAAPEMAEPDFAGHEWMAHDAGVGKQSLKAGIDRKSVVEGKGGEL